MSGTLSYYPDKIEFMGIEIDPLTIGGLLARIGEFIDRKEHALVLNVNVHCLNLAHEQSWLRDMLNQAEIVFCDGAGVILGARLLGQHIPERITYADWMWKLAEFAGNRGNSLYFLGGKPGVAQAAADRLQHRYSNLKIAGVHDGYFEKTPGHPENEAILQSINNVHPNILVVGMGMPLQERWLRDNWDSIDANIALTGGAVFDYVSGDLQRAPRWMTDNGLEWLGRMLVEPGRLWKRYLIGNPRFLLRVLKERVKMT